MKKMNNKWIEEFITLLNKHAELVQNDLVTGETYITYKQGEKRFDFFELDYFLAEEIPDFELDWEYIFKATLRCEKQGKISKRSDFELSIAEDDDVEYAIRIPGRELLRGLERIRLKLERTSIKELISQICWN